jgi:protein-tyrosine phosphatase
MPHREASRMASVLFICTGNIFRSLAAEYALRARLGPGAGHLVGSAGTAALPQAIHPEVLGQLRERGCDPSAHVQRQLTGELLAGADVAVAMAETHRDFVRRHFGRDVPLFNHLCHQTEEPILDLHEAVFDWPLDAEGARRYIRLVIDHIWDSTPRLLGHLERTRRAGE